MKASGAGRAKQALGKVFGFVGRVLKEINPLEWAGDFISDRLKAKAARELLPDIADQTTTMLRAHIEAELDESYFSVRNAELRSKKDVLDAIRCSREEAIDNLQRQKRQAQQDLRRNEQITPQEG